VNGSLSRRGLLQAGAALGGGLLVRMWLPGEAEAATVVKAETFKPNAWLRIDAERVVFECSQAEMGQGVMTSLVTLLCEELEYDPAKVRVDFAPADRAYDNPEMGIQGTGGSTSVKMSWNPLRAAGAVAREALKIAASRRWRVPVAELKAEDGRISHANGKSATYHELAGSAAHVRLPDVPKLKSPEHFKYVGQPLPRFDALAKSTGTATFGIDVKVPGQRVAVVVRGPAIGSTVKSVDDKAAKAMPGVEAVVSLGYGVGVVASTYWHARQGAEKLEIQWDTAKMGSVSSGSIRERWVKQVAQGGGKEAKNHGDARAALAKAAKKLDVVYEAPYLPHAPMEPMNCTAHVTDDRCEIWVPTQSAAVARNVGVELTGLPHERVLVHSTFLGGGFGRRVGFDFVADAVRLAKAVKKPVKVVWSREEDIRHGSFRPASYHELSAGLDAKGALLGVVHKVSSPSILAQTIGPFITVSMPDGMPAPLKSIMAGAVGGMMGWGVDPLATEGAANTAYELPAHRVEWYGDDPGVPLAFWRSVGHSFNGFVMEGFIDELAHAAGKEPLEFRRALLRKSPRHLAVMEQVAQKAGWGTPPPPGVFRGIAQHASFDSYAAAVAEVSVENDDIVVRRVVVGIDCGRVVNPDIVAQQLEGSVIFALSAALKGNITLKDGGVEQSNFHDYEMVRMYEAPVIETHLVRSEEAPTGVGEPAVPVIAPAVANAVFAATGKRLRKLPLSLADAAAPVSERSAG
jgi:CO/xanthine dehydrogenase Mo-binding subunit